MYSCPRGTVRRLPCHCRSHPPCPARSARRAGTARFRAGGALRNDPARHFPAPARASRRQTGTGTKVGQEPFVSPRSRAAARGLRLARSLPEVLAREAARPRRAPAQGGASGRQEEVATTATLIGGWHEGRSEI